MAHSARALARPMRFGWRAVAAGPAHQTVLWTTRRDTNSCGNATWSKHTAQGYNNIMTADMPAAFASRPRVRAICSLSIFLAMLLLGLTPARAQSGGHLDGFLKQAQLSDVF